MSERDPWNQWGRGPGYGTGTISINSAVRNRLGGGGSSYDQFGGGGDDPFGGGSSGGGGWGDGIKKAGTWVANNADWIVPVAAAYFQGQSQNAANAAMMAQNREQFEWQKKRVEGGDPARRDIARAIAARLGLPGDRI